MNDFANRVVLITGAGHGIGRELALQLAAEGAAIAAVDLHADPLHALTTDLAGKPVAVAVADVTDRAALIQATTELEGRLGPVDLLIANAGIGHATSALDFHAAEVEAIVRVNLVGVANSVEAVLPGMLQRRRGHLAAISSLASFRGIPRMAGYCASKAGVNALFDALRAELKPHGIDVTTLCPCWIRTRMTAPLAKRLPDLLEVEDAARRMVEALRRRKAFYAFPPRPTWRLRILNWLPRAWADRLIERQVRHMVPDAAGSPH